MHYVYLIFISGKRCGIGISASVVLDLFIGLFFKKDLALSNVMVASCSFAQNPGKKKTSLVRPTDYFLFILLRIASPTCVLASSREGWGKETKRRMSAEHMIVLQKLSQLKWYSLHVSATHIVPPKEAGSWPSSLTHKSPLGDCAAERIGWAGQKPGTTKIEGIPPLPLPARAASCQLTHETNLNAAPGCKHVVDSTYNSIVVRFES